MVVDLSAVAIAIRFHPPFTVIIIEGVWFLFCKMFHYM